MFFGSHSAEKRHAAVRLPLLPHALSAERPSAPVVARAFSARVPYAGGQGAPTPLPAFVRHALRPDGGRPRLADSCGPVLRPRRGEVFPGLRRIFREMPPGARTVRSGTAAGGSGVAPLPFPALFRRACCPPGLWRRQATAGPPSDGGRRLVPLGMLRLRAGRPGKPRPPSAGPSVAQARAGDTRGAISDFCHRPCTGQAGAHPRPARSPDGAFSANEAAS